MAPRAALGLAGALVVSVGARPSTRSRTSTGLMVKVREDRSVRTRACYLAIGVTLERHGR